MTQRGRYYLLGVSILAISTAYGAPPAQAQTCTGAQMRTATCQDYRGNNVADSYCTTNGLAKPATSQDCTYACPPPPPPPYSGGDGGDGDGGDGGCCDSVGSPQNDNDTSSSAGYGPSDGLGEGGGGGGGGSGGGTVLCTYFHNKGEMPEKDYYAGFMHAYKNLNKYTWRGYHTWAVPYVQYMRAHPNSLAERFIKPLLFLRAEEISYQMGLRNKPNYKGKLVRLAFESFSMSLGLFAKEPDYTKLYTREQMAEFPKRFREYEVRQKQQALRRDPTAMVAI